MPDDNVIPFHRLPVGEETITDNITHIMDILDNLLDLISLIDKGITKFSIYNSASKSKSLLAEFDTRLVPMYDKMASSLKMLGIDPAASEALDRNGESLNEKARSFRVYVTARGLLALIINVTNYDNLTVGHLDNLLAITKFTKVAIDRIISLRYTYVTTVRVQLREVIGIKAIADFVLDGLFIIDWADIGDSLIKDYESITVIENKILAVHSPTPI